MGRGPHVASLGKSSTICNLSLIISVIVKPSKICICKTVQKKKSFFHTISRFFRLPFCRLARVAPRPFFLSKLPRRRNSEPSRAIKAAQHQQRRDIQRQERVGQQRQQRVVQFRQEKVGQFRQQDIAIVRQEPINVADQPIHAAERVFQPVQNNREADPEQQVINPVHEEEEDVLQVQFQEDEQRN